MLKGFREFILRGNVVDLAIAVVIGGAFGAVVASVVDNLLTPLITAIIGKPSFADLTFTIHSSVFHYGRLINAIITFLAVAAAIYFFVVVPLNKVAERRARGGKLAPEEVPEDIALLTEIRDLLAQRSDVSGS